MPTLPQTSRHRNLTFRVSAQADLCGILPARDRDCGCWFLDLLLRRLLSWRVDSERFSRLYRPYIVRFIPERKWSRIRGALTDAGIVDVDPRYRSGERSIGYRLPPRFWSSEPVECGDRRLRQKVRQWWAELESRLLPVDHWLRSWLQHVDVDEQLAERIIATMQPDDDSSMTPEAYRVLARESVGRLSRRPRHLTVCRYGRRHTGITNLPADLRPCVTIEGQHLAGVDLSNSQPLFVGVIAAWHASSKHAAHRQRRNRIGPTGGGGREDPGTPTKRCAFSKTLQGLHFFGPDIRDRTPDLGQFLEICEAGQLYEHLGPEGDRNRTKRQVFHWLYGPLHHRGPLVDRIEREFPTVAQVVADLKRGDHRHVAHLLQHAEASLFIGGVCRRLMAERPEMPVVTIHDSILTTPANVRLVRDTILAEFARLGLRPSLTVESYSPEGVPA